MKIVDYIADVFRERLHRAACLVVYDPDGRYREVAQSLDEDQCRVIEAPGSAIAAREAAMRAWAGLAEGDVRLLVYVPRPKPLEEEDKQADPFHPLALGGAVFPDGEREGVKGDVLRLRGAGTSDRNTQKRLDDLEELKRELEAMREELLRVAALPYRPDQNDGVLIAAAPLRRLFRHKPWQRDLENCWKALESGEHDWAHLALAIWSDRVRETCGKDKSIAIAHDLEDLYKGD